MRRETRKPHGLKARLYAAHLIDLNEYLAVFPGEKKNEKNYMTDLNENVLNSTTNSWNKKVYVQIFDFEYIT